MIGRPYSCGHSRLIDLAKFSSLARMSFEALLNEVSEQNEPTFKFESLAEDDISRLVKTSLDVDMLSIQAKCCEMFSLDSISPVESLLTGCMANFLKSTYVEVINLKTKRKIVVFAESEPYRFGVSYAFNTEEEVDHKIEASRIKINEILSSVQTDKKAFRVFKALLLEEFANVEICLFSYGQKQNLTEVKERLELIIQTFPVNIAIANETQLEGCFLSCRASYEKQVKEFSNFGSNYACNIEINDELAASFNKSCFKLNCYNSFKHYKKAFKLKIDIGRNINESLKDSILTILNNRDLIEIKKYINLNKLRIEGNFEIKSIDDFRSSLKSIEEGPVWLRILKIDSQII